MRELAADADANRTQQEDVTFVMAKQTKHCRSCFSVDTLRGHKIVHFQRKPYPGQVSIEVVFKVVRATMRDLGIDVEIQTLPHHSKGLLSRIASVWWAGKHQGDINHITGDVHFVALGIAPDRTILTIHDCRALERLSRVKHWIMKKVWFELPIRRAAIVTVVSEETRQQLRKWLNVPLEKIVIVPNAAAPIFKPCPKQFDKNRPTILHIGTAENKNLSRLIEAIRNLNCHLHVIGRLNCAHFEQLKMAHVSYRIDTDLSEQAMYSAYCNADLLSFVSTYEGFGMPIIEAQWVERPIVTSNCSAMPEVAGNGACFVDPLNVQSIRSGFDRIINDAVYRNELIENGRENRKRFAASEIARQYLDLYAQVANKMLYNR